jgi:inner membrane protein
MMGKSHLLIGLGVGVLLATAMHYEAVHIAAMTVVAGAGAMLPDIDHRHAPIRKRLGLLGDVLLFWLPHRGVTHSLLCLAFCSAVWIFLVPTLGPLLVWGWHYQRAMPLT